MLKKRFFKTKDDCEVTFHVTAEGAEHVELVCEANGWEPIVMKKAKNGSFRARLRVPKQARYQFRYLIDNTSWANDDAADGSCRNEFGGENSILDTTPG